jgi:transcriptional regulator with XRE-family HTH domain
MTQEALAFASRINRSAISNVERGVIDPSWSSVRTLARALGMTMGQLGAAVDREHGVGES